MTCFMCSIDQGAIAAENDLALAIRDSFPVSPGHTLVIPDKGNYRRPGFVPRSVTKDSH